jgi:hypothetical protein
MKELIWLPIDVPKLPDISSLAILDDTFEGYAYWRFLRLTEKQTTPYEISTWKNIIKNKCPDLIDWFQNLPFKNIRNVKLNYQQQEVNGHIDFTNPSDNLSLWHNNNENEPCGYRILVNSSRKNCLWVENDLKDKIICNMPEHTDTYVLNHTNGIHGVYYDDERWTIFCHAEIDYAKHAELIARSLMKYQEFAIYK